MTFAERLAALLDAPAVENFPHGRPVLRDPWGHVSGRGYRTTTERQEFPGTHRRSPPKSR